MPSAPSLTAMAFYRLSRITRDLRRHHRRSSFIYGADSNTHSPPASSTNNSTHPRQQLFNFFEFSGNFNSRNLIHKSCNAVRSAGSCHRLPVRTSYFSKVASGEKEEKPKNPNSSEGDCSWIDVYLPEKTRPYARLARGFSLGHVCGKSITMAAAPGSIPDIKMMMLFGTWALLFRGVVCIVNDLLDRDIDIQVERTRLRPIASGVITPFQGLCFLVFQLLLGLGTLLPMNSFSRVLGAPFLLLVFSYPLMKRVTYWPQAYLGLTFNWGALLGWAAVEGSIDPAIILPLYASGVFWTLVYDIIYAHQDKEDDVRVGVKSTAYSTKEWITGFGIACIGSLLLADIMPTLNGHITYS